MAIGVRGTSSTTNTTATTTHAVTKPTGAASGDVGYVGISMNGSSISTGPSGWTAISTAPIAGPTNPKVVLYRRVLDGGANDNFSMTTTTAVASGLIYHCLTGVDNTTPEDTAVSENGSNTTAASGTLTGVTTVTDGALLIGTMGVNSGTTTITQPGTMTEILEVGGKRQEMASESRATAGATGDRQWTFGASRAWAGAMVAVRPAGAGTTPVSNTLATSWNVVKQVAQSRSTTWHVVAQVGASRSTLWNVLTTVSPKTLASSWNVLGAVAAARSTLWNVSASVSKALATSWNVLSVGLTPVSKALTSSWHVIGQVAKATSTSWHVRAQVAASRATSWSVLSSVVAARSTLWNVAARVAASRSTLWHVVGRVTATRSTTWNVKVVVAAARSTTWNVRTVVAASRSTLWNVLSFVSASRSTTWNVVAGLQAVSRPLSTAWHVASRLGRTFSTYWGVTTPTVTLTVNNAAHTSASSQPSLTITHVIAQVNGASHGLRSGEPTLVQNSTLLVRDASHRLESDRVHLKQWKQAYLFRTPFAGAVAFHTDRLVVRLGLPAGVTLLVNGGIVVESQYPTEEQLAAADAAYVGGHEYVITPSAAAILITAGYGEYLSPTQVLQEA